MLLANFDASTLLIYMRKYLRAVTTKTGLTVSTTGT